MNCLQKHILKAAYKSAAFLFLLIIKTNSSYAQTPKTSIENIRSKVAEMLASSKKEQAIGLLINFSKTDRAKAHKAEVAELLFVVGQTFLNKEAQEFYEASLNESLESERSSLKSVEKCLKVDEYNLDCRIQKARMLYRSKKKNEAKDALSSVQALLLNTQYEKMFSIYLERDQPEFKSTTILNSLPSQPNDKTLVLISHEIERAFAAKNYSRAKEVLSYGEKHFSDWPDSAYFRHKLNAESMEDAQDSRDDLMTVYANRCKSISKTISRKYRYDFDLCLRGKNEK